MILAHCAPPPHFRGLFGKKTKIQQGQKVGGEGGGHSGPKSLILAPQDIPDISGHQLGFGCQCVKAHNNENPVGFLPKSIFDQLNQNSNFSPQVTSSTSSTAVLDIMVVWFAKLF